MSRQHARLSGYQLFASEAAAYEMSQHEYLGALKEALIVVRVLARYDGFGAIGTKELLYRLLTARKLAERPSHKWADYKKALGLTGET